jgi:alanyl-tRNA synthetase
VFFTQKVSKFMTEEKKIEGSAKIAKAAKPSRSKNLEERLAAIEAQAKTLREKLRDEQRKEREENARAVAAMLKAEDLDGFDITAWRIALPELKAALSKATAASTKGIGAPA